MLVLSPEDVQGIIDFFSGLVGGNKRQQLTQQQVASKVSAIVQEDGIPHYSTHNIDEVLEWVDGVVEKLDDPQTEQALIFAVFYCIFVAKHVPEVEAKQAAIKLAKVANNFSGTFHHFADFWRFIRHHEDQGHSEASAIQKGTKMFASAVLKNY